MKRHARLLIHHSSFQSKSRPSPTFKAWILAIFPTEELKMSQEEQRRRRSTPSARARVARPKALALLILASLLASSCATSRDANDGSVAPQVETRQATSANANASGPTGTYTVYDG